MLWSVTEYESVTKYEVWQNVKSVKKYEKLSTKKLHVFQNIPCWDIIPIITYCKEYCKRTWIYFFEVKHGLLQQC